MLQLWHHIVGRLLGSADPSHAADDSDSDDGSACFAQPDKPEQSTDRVTFGTRGAMIYGYPSTGGVLVKAADPVDMQFLSLSCLDPCDRAKDAATEDRFCQQMLKVGATFWESKRSRNLSLFFDEDLTKEQTKVVVYGWPADGHGVWVLRYDDEQQLPDDFGKIRLVTSMEAKIEVMKSFNATFVDDVSQIKELDLARLPRLLPVTTVHIKDWKGPVFIAR